MPTVQPVWVERLKHDKGDIAKKNMKLGKLSDKSVDTKGNSTAVRESEDELAIHRKLSNLPSWPKKPITKFRENKKGFVQERK